jgi:hypothetical protein
MLALVILSCLRFRSILVYSKGVVQPFGSVAKTGNRNLLKLQMELSLVNLEYLLLSLQLKSLNFVTHSVSRSRLCLGFQIGQPITLQKCCFVELQLLFLLRGN